MKISFVIPAYNEERHLPQCLAAVERELARHAGLAASAGELIANIDADTMPPEGWPEVARRISKVGKVKWTFRLSQCTPRAGGSSMKESSSLAFDTP